MELVQQKLIEDLPVGYTSAVIQPEDAEQVGKLWKAVFTALGEQREYDAEEIRKDWESPDYNREASARCVRDASGQLVGYINVWDTGKPPVHPYVSFGVHPAHVEAGIVQPMLNWVEERCRQAIDRCPPDKRVSMLIGTNGKNEALKAQYDTYGLKPIRYFFRMVINMTETPSAPKLPEGYSIRPMQYPDELEATIRAQIEAFKDHWGFVEEPIETVLTHWQHEIDSDKLYDPSLWFLAIDDTTGEIAGISLCRTELWGQPNLAYVLDLAVLREHRKKGLALALLHHSFAEFWQRGRKNVALHVDASSLTGAVRLYERAGMHQDEVSINYELVLRDGEEMMTTAAGQKD